MPAKNSQTLIVTLPIPFSRNVWAPLTSTRTSQVKTTAGLGPRTAGSHHGQCVSVSSTSELGPHALPGQVPKGWFESSNESDTPPWMFNQVSLFHSRTCLFSHVLRERFFKERKRNHNTSKNKTVDVLTNKA